MCLCRVIHARCGQDGSDFRDALLILCSCLQALDPVQHAHGLLASFPYTPDMLALCGLLAAHEQVGPKDLPHQQVPVPWV